MCKIYRFLQKMLPCCDIPKFFQLLYKAINRLKNKALFSTFYAPAASARYCFSSFRCNWYIASTLRLLLPKPPGLYIHKSFHNRLLTNIP